MRLPESHFVRALALAAAPLDLVNKNAFQPAAVGAARSPCPALNALANHGFL